MEDSAIKQGFENLKAGTGIVNNGLVNPCEK